MKSIFAIFVAGLLAIPTVAPAAIIIDGTADAAYGSAIVTQQLGTAFGDNTNAVIGAATGSELDTAYGMISNGVLYLVLAGNFERNNNHLNLFFQSDTGGQNTLTNINPGVDFNYLNNLSNLTFDATFAPNYYLSANVGGGASNNPCFVNYAALYPRGAGFNGSVTSNGFFLGQITVTNGNGGVLSGGSDPFGVKIGVNNSNIAGVTGDGSGCYSNETPFNPGAVTTGIELAIPLGAIGSPAGNVTVCAFIAGGSFISNQILGPLGTNDPNYCQGNLGNPTSTNAPPLNLGNLPGQHYFVVIAPPCSYSINPQSAQFNFPGGSGSVSVNAGFGCTWAATSNVPWVTITSGATGSGAGTVNYTVATNASTLVRSGTMSIAAQTFTVNQGAEPLGSIAIDGTAEAGYGSAIVTQVLGTTFADNALGQVDASSGSELDTAYGIISNGVLFITLSGNLASSLNDHLEIFFQTGPGGQNVLTNVNPDVDGDGLNRMGVTGNGSTNGPGLKFDAAFSPNYYITVKCGGAPIGFDAYYAQLWPGSTNSSGIATNGYFLGSTTIVTNYNLFGGTNPFGIQAALNNANIGGVDSSGAGCFEDPGTFGQGAITTGVELAIPLGAIGSPSGPVKICAFINGGGHGYVSSQVLGPIWDGTTIYCFTGPDATGNPAEPSFVDFSTYPGTHYFVVANPQPFQPVITNISRTNQDIYVTWTTQSGLTYQLQSTKVLSTNTPTWNSVGSSTNATGSVITQVDSMAATNRPTFFYRVDQTSP